MLPAFPVCFGNRHDLAGGAEMAAATADKAFLYLRAAGSAGKTLPVVYQKTGGIAVFASARCLIILR